uniref:Sideroflexin 4 n=1 Tax=Periophthalmus magnuspinnatus TaxID=409849 RepID=A0A3B4A1B7_9GOBI
MDPNLLHWKGQGQSFLGRLKTWCDLLDPTLLVSSDVSDVSFLFCFLIYCFWKIQPVFTKHVLAYVYNFCCVCVFIYFVCIYLQEKKISLKQLLLNVGTVSYATCTGTLPQIIINRLQVRNVLMQNFCRTVLPVPLAAILAFLNLSTVRSEETDNGIQVFDSEGNAVGLSKAAGEKAVRETALSRAALIGATAAGPNLIKRSLLLVPLRPFSVVFLLGLMIPVSFSLFPQLGTIKKENLEEELQGAALEGGHLYYHRGL